MEFSGERVVLDYAGISAELRARVTERGASEAGLRAEVERVIARHLARYHFAAALLAARSGRLTILDVACGSGYGAYLLAGRGAASERRVVGVDLDAEAIGYATANFTGPGLQVEFCQGDCRALPWTAPTFDAIVSFETLEHLEQHDGARFVARLAALLRPGGFVVLSTPAPHPRRANPFHLHEYEQAELAALLGAHFAHCRLFEQGVVVGSAILPLDASPREERAGARSRLDREAPLSPPPLVVAPAGGVAPFPAMRNFVAVCAHDVLPDQIATAIYCFDPALTGP